MLKKIISPYLTASYDEIGILKPARINSSGYRIYGQTEVNRLQQIMFYRELGVNLEAIKDIVTSASFDQAAALKEHHERLLAKREQLNLLIMNVEKTIEFEEGRKNMKDKEKFEGFKKKLIDDNEQKYGKEVREKYGDKTVNASNQKMLNMTEEQYAGLAQMYLDDERFTAFYDKKQPGMAVFLRDAIFIYTGKNA